MRSYIQIDDSHFDTDWQIGLQKDKARSSIDSDKYVLKEWSTGENIEVSVSILKYSLNDFYREKALSSDLVLGFTLSWFSSSTGTGYRGLIDRKTIENPADSNDTISLRGSIPGDRIAGYLFLTLNIVILASKDLALPKGLILGTIQKTVLIEGNLSQFPVQILHFGEEPGFAEIAGAFYKLKRNINAISFDDFFNNDYTLYLNEDHRFTSKINVTEKKLWDDAEGIARMLMLNVYQEIINDLNYILAREDIIQWKKAGRHAPEQVGSVYLHIIGELASFKGCDESNICSLIQSDPAAISDYLQSLIIA